MPRQRSVETVGVSSSNMSQLFGAYKRPPSSGRNQNIQKSTIEPMSSSSFDALPKQFVVTMKTLFDILDDQQTGYVKLSDIEKGWQGNDYKGMPHGVIDSLRKVTPTSGLLSFERFCTGLRLCLLRNQIDSAKRTAANSSSTATISDRSPSKAPVAPAAPLLDFENPLPTTTWGPTGSAINASVGLPQTPAFNSSQRAYSMPQLSPDSDLMEASHSAVYGTPPPKPPRATAASASATAARKAKIRDALQNWQMSVLLNEMGAKESSPRGVSFSSTPFVNRGSADGGSSSATDSGAVDVASHPKKSIIKRREPRRHTLQNGIDYNMLKRLKQFEEEYEVLMIGLDAVEKARGWYIQQVADVQEKMKYLGRLGTQNLDQELWPEAHQERLNFKRTRILEATRNLQTLTNSLERGSVPTNLNLGTPSPPKRAAAGGGSAGVQPSERQRQFSRQLNNELNLKSERVAVLEREKQSLMHDLYELQRLNGSLVNSGYGGGLGSSSPGCSTSSGGLGDADVVY